MAEWRLVIAMLAVLLLGSCRFVAEQAPGSLFVRNARIDPRGDAAVLELGLDCRLSGPMRDALERKRRKTKKK